MAVGLSPSFPCSWRTSSGSIFGLRPLQAPRAFAAAIPPSAARGPGWSRTRRRSPACRRKPLPAAVEVSTGCSMAFSVTPFAVSSWTMSCRSLRERASRSMRMTTRGRPGAGTAAGCRARRGRAMRCRSSFRPGPPGSRQPAAQPPAARDLGRYWTRGRSRRGPWEIVSVRLGTRPGYATVRNLTEVGLTRVVRNTKVAGNLPQHDDMKPSDRAGGQNFRFFAPGNRTHSSWTGHVLQAGVISRIARGHDQACQRPSGDGAGTLVRPLKSSLITLVVDFHPELTRVWSEPLGLDPKTLRN